MRAGLHAEAEERAAQDFWLDTEAGSVLVRAERLELEARAVRQKQVLAVVDGEIEQVSEAIRELKQLQREAGGRSAAEFGSERRRLAKVATLLCAVRAAARGRVHMKGTLESQAKWIAANSHLADGGAGSKSVGLSVDRWEITIEEGQRVEVEGICQEEAILATLAACDGYRSRPTALVLRAPAEAPIRVVGVGEIAPSRTEIGTDVAVESKVALDPWEAAGWSAVIVLVLLEIWMVLQALLALAR